MHTIATIRFAARGDYQAISSIAEDTDLFPGDMLPGMIAPFLEDAACTDIWLVIENAGLITGFTFCEPERMTQGTANMLALGIRPQQQGQAQGSALTKQLESILRDRGYRMLLVETLGLPEFDRTRRFYAQRGFSREAVIRDFYDVGQDKVVFRKML